MVNARGRWDLRKYRDVGLTKMTNLKVSKAFSVAYYMCHTNQLVMQVHHRYIDPSGHSAPLGQSQVWQTKKGGCYKWVLIWRVKTISISV